MAEYDVVRRRAVLVTKALALPRRGVRSAVASAPRRSWLRLLAMRGSHPRPKGALKIGGGLYTRFFPAVACWRAQLFVGA